MQSREYTLEVWGSLACFTSPLLKAERFSYGCPTPSSVRGIFDSIYCKPIEFRWQVTKIDILEPIRYIALRRNEVKEKVSVSAVGKWMRGTAEPSPLIADSTDSGNDQKGRTQRQTMALRDVRYRISAQVVPWPNFEDSRMGIQRQFERRASHGKCVWQPTFGCREFPAYFTLIKNEENQHPENGLTQDFGWMLYDVFDLSKPGTAFSKPSVSVYQAKAENGRIHVPSYESNEVLKGQEVL